MQDLKPRKIEGKQIGLLVLVDVISVIALLAAGYFWMEGRFGQLEKRVDELSAQQAHKDDTTGTPTPVGPSAPVTQYRSKQGAIITIDSPLSNSTIKSPLMVKGKAPNSWFFEGQFSLSLKDSHGTIVANGPTDIATDWQKDGPVAFTASLTWSKPVSGDGRLVLQKDNPSGLAKNDDSVEIPVKF